MAQRGYSNRKSESTPFSYEGRRSGATAKKSSSTGRARAGRFGGPKEEEEYDGPTQAMASMEDIAAGPDDSFLEAIDKKFAEMDSAKKKPAPEMDWAAADKKFDLSASPSLSPKEKFEAEEKEYAEEQSEKRLADLDKQAEEAFKDVEESPAAEAEFKEPVAKEEVKAELPEDEANRLFKLIMGSSFDPKSSMDKGKMEILKAAKAKYPDLSDTQLALKIYREM